MASPQALRAGLRENDRRRTGERERERERIDRSLRLLMLRARQAGLTERENDRRGRGERESDRE